MQSAESGMARSLSRSRDIRRSRINGKWIPKIDEEPRTNDRCRTILIVQFRFRLTSEYMVWMSR